MKSAVWLFLLAVYPLQAEPLVVHEWGTFTVLQDENGEAIAGINIDDEPVPPFVHRIGNLVRTAREAVASKAPLPQCHPDVRMRLETPVVYFYPPAGEELVADVDVEFPGGWISEFYPGGSVIAPGLDEGKISPAASGRLIWKGLQVGGAMAGPETASPVWLIPREVDAKSVRTKDGETERYLFYRGVANMEAPVRIRREGGVLKMSGETRLAWLADFRGDGTAAFRRAGTEMPASFTDYSRTNLEELRSEMRDELIEEGLFPKEAEAMLKTWENSYFQSRGLRLFYIVPREWTDRHLPLKISVEAEVVRVMIGRIELVTPEQRRTLERLVTLDVVNASALPGGYFLLGRFAPALLADEHRRRPTEETMRWMSALQIGAE